MTDITHKNDPEAGGAPSTQQGQGGGGRNNVTTDLTLYEFKEQLLLLSTLVTTVTYVAGLNLPGGSWEQDDPGGHIAGDPILRDIHYRRYLAFYYCNATALAASFVISLVLIILREKDHVWTVVLRVVMVLDLLSLMGSYGAGSCRDAFTTIYAAVAFSVLVFCIIVVFLSYLWLNGENEAHPNSMCIPHARKKDKENMDLLMLLATFAITITYVAGLSPPGGFWSSTEDGHHLSDPVLQARHRFRAFFVCNTTSFVVSLLIVVFLLEKMMLGEKVLFGGMTWFQRKKLMGQIEMRLAVPYGFIAVALLGLMGAYAAGSCRGAGTTILVLTMPVCIFLLLALVFLPGRFNLINVFKAQFKDWFGTPRGTLVYYQHQQTTRNLGTLLAILVVTITYQAGLDPPGGLWQEDRDGHKMGHPVLQTTHPIRYKVFFYSNSTAFVTSLFIILMFQNNFLLTRHIVEATLVLDLLGLIIAYGAGSTRDVNTSIYIVALAGLVLVYVIVHITIRDHAPEPEGGDDAVKDLDDKRKLLLLVAIFAATLTYQAGLTPPGGFWLADDKRLGRLAGFPILLDNYPRRYNIFIYCNAASFMASITLILLLMNPKFYRPGIRCYALYVCMFVGMFGLMGAYAAGSSRHLKTSIYVLTLIVPVLAFITLLATLVWFFHNNNNVTSTTTAMHNNNITTTLFCFLSRVGHGSRDNTPTSNNNNNSNNTISNTNANTTTIVNINTNTTTNTDNNDDNENNEEKVALEYLMLLGILGASMTYQTGLKPPGGLWQNNTDGHSAGNPILRDNHKHRYNAFFYSNSISFMASIVVVVMLLPLTIKRKFQGPDLPLWPMHTAILLDMLSLLVAYAAGSTRKWETSRNVIFLIIPVFLYIAVYVAASVFYHRKDRVLIRSNAMYPAE
ncbi:hypothetical protein ACQJBY_061929 [Aegilops geniculata]